ncbi:TIGR04372 family glycosyltransferase [Dehalococcoidia bacterium]|nr:TIGR04372 family glycosyltransferase [Dehalococcoidia bacterium]
MFELLFRWLLHRVLVFPLRVLVLISLHLVGVFKPIKIIMVHDGSIGALAQYTDHYLRGRRAFGKVAEPQGMIIGVARKPSNDQLLKMLQRQFFIVQNQRVHDFVNGQPLRFSRFVGGFNAPVSPKGYQLWESDPVLSFTEDEEIQGKDLLRKMGINDDNWFVCFHARDAAYTLQNFPEELWADGLDQMSSIKNFIQAMKYVVSCGGYALRMGAPVQDRLPELGEPQIIDYASDYRTDFGDIYLSARCKFFVGSMSGLSSVAATFSVPVVKTNMFYTSEDPYGHRDLVIYKLIWSNQKGRLLTYPEILESEVGGYLMSCDYDQADLKVFENTSEEILGVTQEMIDRLSGEFVCEADDEILQQRFRSLFQPQHGRYESPAKVGTQYLRTHRDLLQ